MEFCNVTLDDLASATLDDLATAEVCRPIIYVVESTAVLTSIECVSALRGIEAVAMEVN